MPPITPLSAARFVDGQTPIPTDAQFAWFRMAERPETILVDFVNRRAMAMTLERISIFVETNNRRAVPSSDEWNAEVAKMGLTPCSPTVTSCGVAEGHDLRMYDIAEFYNVCRTQQIPLSNEERIFEEQLIVADALRRDRSGHLAAPTPAVVVGMARDLPLKKRLTVFVHEATHATFMLDAVMHRQVSGIWQNLSDAERALIRRGFAKMAVYDPENTELIVTELQAYMMSFPPFEHPLMAKLLEAGAATCSRSAEKYCEQILPGSIKVAALLRRLYEALWAVSACSVPLLASASLQNDRLVIASPPESCHATPPVAPQRWQPSEIWNDPIEGPITRAQDLINTLAPHDLQNPPKTE